MRKYFIRPQRGITDSDLSACDKPQSHEAMQIKAYGGKTVNITIRNMRPGDADALYRLLSDPEVMRYLEPPYDRVQAEAFLHHAGLSEPPLRLCDLSRIRRGKRRDWLGAASGILGTRLCVGADGPADRPGTTGAEKRRARVCSGTGSNQADCAQKGLPRLRDL